MCRFCMKIKSTLRKNMKVYPHMLNMLLQVLNITGEISFKKCFYQCFLSSRISWVKSWSFYDFYVTFFYNTQILDIFVSCCRGTITSAVRMNSNSPHKLRFSAILSTTRNKWSILLISYQTKDLSRTHTQFKLLHSLSLLF